ncbi:sushi, von Willebrand factor type A, EGF and pentraxin domain-containing protein 1-like isoform X2 [Sycon ciliatum]|uniref:sushi, von Willebrand factor type A, EGF and pentraxin domain-containing protein 1-like isoform X2 n=1 Tax=Sycon ciliatum TaxID=27933 RepID=UPI0031F65B24
MNCHGHNATHGVWANPVSCNAYMRCPSDIKVKNGVVTVNSNYTDGTATVTCNQGYRPPNALPMKCKEHNVTHNVWTNILTCNPFSGYCPSSVSLTNGQFNAISTQIKGTASVKCDPGYRPSKLTPMNCHTHNAAHGVWTNLTSCNVYMRCPSDIKVKNGIVTVNSNYTDGTAAVTCNQGYRPPNALPMKCEQHNVTHNVWTNILTCNPYMLCPSDIKVKDGVVTVSSNYTNGTATVTCNQGYRPPNTLPMKCEEHNVTHNVWTHQLSCNLYMRCPSDIKVKNGIVTVNSNYTDGNATVTCNQGYRPPNALPMKCEEHNVTHNVWTNQLSCNLYMRCPSDIKVKNGIVTVNSNYTDGNATVTCNKGYRPPNALPMKCEEHNVTHNVWTNILTCNLKPAYCSSTINVTNGVVRVNKAYLGEEANGTCNRGYSPTTNSTMKCMVKDELAGVWTNVLSCNRRPKYCSAEEIKVNNGVYYTADTYIGAVYQLLCDPGFRKSKKSETTCQAHNDTHGIWSNILTCNFIHGYCSSAINLTNGVVHVSNTHVGAEANGTCNQGYLPSNNSTMTCQEQNATHGVWDNLLSCNRISTYCSTVTSIIKGVVHANYTHIGAEANVTCNHSYRLSNNSKVTCQAYNDTHGVWKNLSCNLYSRCPNNVHVPNGIVNVFNNDTGGEANVTCNTGYRPSNNATLKCQKHNATHNAWIIPLTCKSQPISCPKIIPISNGSYLIFGETYAGSVATIACNQGYRSPNNSTTTCQPRNETHGVWNNVLNCNLYSRCPNNVNVPNGIVNVFNNDTGGEADVTCNTGYRPSNNATLKCQKHNATHNAWTNLLSCDPIPTAAPSTSYPTTTAPTLSRMTAQRTTPTVSHVTAPPSTPPTGTTPTVSRVTAPRSTASRGTTSTVSLVTAPRSTASTGTTPTVNRVTAPRSTAPTGTTSIVSRVTAPRSSVPTTSTNSRGTTSTVSLVTAPRSTASTGTTPAVSRVTAPRSTAPTGTGNIVAAHTAHAPATTVAASASKAVSRNTISLASSPVNSLASTATTRPPIPDSNESMKASPNSTQVLSAMTTAEMSTTSTITVHHSNYKMDTPAPESSTSAAPTTDVEVKGASNTGAIVGGIFGGLVGILVVASLFLFKHSSRNQIFSVNQKYPEVVVQQSNCTIMEDFSGSDNIDKRGSTAALLTGIDPSKVATMETGCESTTKEV